LSICASTLTTLHGPLLSLPKMRMNQQVSVCSQLRTPCLHKDPNEQYSRSFDLTPFPLSSRIALRKAIARHQPAYRKKRKKKPRRPRKGHAPLSLLGFDQLMRMFKKRWLSKSCNFKLHTKSQTPYLRRIPKSNGKSAAGFRSSPIDRNGHHPGLATAIGQPASRRCPGRQHSGAEPPRPGSECERYPRSSPFAGRPHTARYAS
jgi:hypothetical protein